MSVRVEAPRLNANEDQLQIVQVLIKEGQQVAAGELLFVAETTKASHEITAPASGQVHRLQVRAGAMVEVGAALCLLEAADRAAAGAATVAAEDPAIKVTLKAKQRAMELGIPLDAVVPLAGRIGVEQVEDHARRTGIATTAPSPAGSSPRHPMRAFVYGAGGHATIILDLLARGGHEVVGCVADDGEPGSEIVPGVRLLGGPALLERFHTEGVRTAFIGVGGIESNVPRRQVFERLTAMGFDMPPLIATSAHVGIAARIGPATVVCPGAVIGPRVTIGANCIINAAAVVSHHSVVGDHCHVTPGALIAGECRIGAGSTIGMAATLLNRSDIGADCLIHNNATVAGKVLDATEITAKGARLQRRPPS